MGKLLKFIVWAAAIVGLVIGALRLTCIRWWTIPADDPLLGASIMPTLEAGDLVVLWRATPPAFGDLVVCPNPEDPSLAVVARIVGEEGDSLTIEGAGLEVNNRRVFTESACEKFEVEHPVTGALIEHNCATEALGGVLHMRGSVADSKMAMPVKSTRKVGDGTVFLVSDNRSFPHDSRRYGAVDRSTCKETVVLRLVSRRGYSDVERRFTYIR